MFFRLIFLCASSVFLIATAEGDVQQLQTFVRFGLDGTFSANCAEPASTEQPRMMFAHHSDGRGNQLGILTAIVTQKGTFNHLSGRIQGAHLSLDTQSLTYMLITLRGERFLYNWMRVGEGRFRLLSLDERTRNIQYVNDGIITATGIATPVLQRCRN